MKTNVRKPNSSHFFVTSDSLATPANFLTNSISSIKRILYLFIFAGIASLLNSCEAGWVASEPSYGIELERPARPGEGYMWIDGGWRWDNHSHNYIRERGYWARPRPNHAYSKGYWRSGPRGKAWVRGHWRRGSERDNRR